MANNDSLLARMDAQRTHWADLPDGKRVQFRRPLETEFGRFREGVGVEHVAECVCGWDGFTEADLLGAALGSDAAVTFDPALWSRVMRDRVDYMQPVAQAIAKAIGDHLQAKEAAAKTDGPPRCAGWHRVGGRRPTPGHRR